MSELLATITRDDGSSDLELHRPINAAPDDLWNAIVDPEVEARWLGALTGDLREGGHYRVTFDDSDPSALVDGEIRQCVAGRKLEVTWQAPGDEVSTVLVSLSPTPEGTDLHLRHTGLTPSSDTGHAAGWQVHLDQLTSGLESGDWTDRWDTWSDLQEQYAAQLKS